MTSRASHGRVQSRCHACLISAIVSCPWAQFYAKVNGSRSSENPVLSVVSEKTGLVEKVAASHAREATDLNSD